MPFTLEKQEGILKIGLTGSVTVRHAAALAGAICAHLEPPEDLSVTIDAGDLDHLDSSVLQVFVSLQKAGHSIQISSVGPIPRLLQRYGMKRQLGSSLPEDDHA